MLRNLRVFKRLANLRTAPIALDPREFLSERILGIRVLENYNIPLKFQRK